MISTGKRILSSNFLLICNRAEVYIGGMRSSNVSRSGVIINQPIAKYSSLGGEASQSESSLRKDSEKETQIPRPVTTALGSNEINKADDNGMDLSDIHPDWLSLERRLKMRKPSPKGRAVSARGVRNVSAWDGENV